MDETEFRIFMTVLAYGCEWHSAPGDEPIEKRIGLHEESFFRDLYEPVPGAEQELLRSIEAGNRLICLHGRPGSGKSTVLRRVLRELRGSGHPILVVDFLRDFPSRVSGELREPTTLVEAVGKLLKEKAWGLFMEHAAQRRELLGFYLDRLDALEREFPVERRFVPSPAMAEAVRTIRIEQEIIEEEADARGGGREPQASRSLLAWAVQQARQGNARIREAVHNGLAGADARDILYALRLGYRPDRKVIVVFDNMDSVPFSDDVIAARNWIRAQVGPFLDCATFVYSIRPETLALFPTAPSEGAAIRTTRVDFDRQSRSREAMIAAGDQRRTFEQRVVQRRLVFLKQWYESQSARLPDTVAELFSAFWAARLVPRVREDADALANWNYRTLVTSLGNFARELCSRLKVPWTRFDWDREQGLPDALAIHVESMYYAWLAGALSPGSKAHFSVAEYNPVEWHRVHVQREPDEEPSLLGQKSGHIALATVHNLARQDNGRAFGPAPTRLVAERLVRLGFTPNEIRGQLMALCVGLPAPTFGSSRCPLSAESHAAGEGTSSEGATSTGQDAAGGWFGRRPSEVRAPRHLLQSVMLGETLVAIGDGVRLPQYLELTDRGRQIVEYLAVKLHFLVGLFEAASAGSERMVRSGPTDLESSPISPQAYERFNRRLRRMAGFHVRCVEDALRRLRPEFGDAAFDTLRRWYCLPGEAGARYPGENNLFMDRCLLSIEKYMERLNAARFKDDASLRYLTEARLLRRQFGDYIEQAVVPQARGERREVEIPGWLADFDRYRQTLRARPGA